MKNLLTFAIVLAILAWIIGLNINVAFAQSCPIGTPISGCGSGSGSPGGGGGPDIKPAPAPIAGAGLIYVALAGGYYAVRRWRSTGKNKF
jgi:hypothetical protein